ncbi:TraG family conjugative transposon ATPase [Croceitalea marina]|uniref:TraG family conjugative transposon ATPase n=1 Tax=Croceitalea marina TaxID=1775166 RepID=A0ABW5MRR2_9FLAO
MKTIDFASRSPILTMEGNTVFASNGNVVLAYAISLPEIHSLSETDFEELHATWFQALKSLPTGTIIHKQDTYRKKAFDTSALPQHSFLEKATAEHFQGRETMEHQSQLYFILPHNKGMQQSKYCNPFLKVPKALPKEQDDRLQHFVRNVTDAVNYLNNSRKFSIQPMQSEVFEAHTHAYFNGFAEDMDTDILLGSKGIQVGDHHFDVLAINSELCFGETVQSSIPNPSYTSDAFSFHQGFIDGLGLTLEEDHIVNQILYLDDKQKWRKSLDKKIEELNKSSNFGSQNKVVLEKVSKIRDHINEDDQSQVIRGHLNIIYWHKEKSQLESVASKIKATLKELDILPYHPKGAVRIHYFLNSYPCHAPNFSDGDLYVTDLKHALCLFLNTTNYQSDTTGILFNERVFNIPVFKDVWDEQKKRIKARNFAIFAPTGEGKSFLANHILRQYFESGVRLVIIDLGGSYTKFAQLYPDQHAILRYEKGQNLGINPFYITSEADLDPERLEDLAHFLFELYAADSPISKSQSVALKKLLLAYYEAVRSGHSLNGFYVFLAEHHKALLERLNIDAVHFDVADFLHILSEYVDNGLYSFLFASSEDQTYRLEDKRLIIFELDEVKDHKELLSIMLKLIKTAIQRTIWRNRSERGIILFDEFAKQLKFGNVLESVEFYYQAIRKQNGAIGIILQSINQLPDTHTSASILENTQVIYSLRNEKGYKDLKDRLNLSDHDMDQLRSMQNDLTGERKYTEFFLKIGKEGNVFRLEVPPEVYAAYLTDGVESEAIMALYGKYGSMEKAINEFLTQKSTTT